MPSSPGSLSADLDLHAGQTASGCAPFRDAFVYAAVIASLIWRPDGLFASKVSQAEGVIVTARRSILAQTISTPVILIAILVVIALAAVAVGSGPFNQTVIEIFIRIVLVVGLYVFIETPASSVSATSALRASGPI